MTTKEHLSIRPTPTTTQSPPDSPFSVDGVSLPTTTEELLPVASLSAVFLWRKS
ncbi:hypothetical protein KSP40_PGU021343 [Platanthera guangdongensis]|uniref:Uncharacterized protein n=1 Tax=Platanthera guangdongensis TaxID=2320717 RepID=A0ABR2MZD6_9ASPA